MWRSPAERLLRTISLLVALSAVSAPVSAQVVQGRLLDTATDQPVVTVTVQLLRGEKGDNAVATHVTDEQGHFVLHAPASGTYRLRTTRIGYQQATTRPFDLLRGEDPFEVEVRISAVAVLLAPLTIVSERTARVGSLHLETERRRRIRAMMVREQEVSEYLPHFDRMLFDEEGRLWVRTLGEELSNLHPYLLEDVNHLEDAPELRPSFRAWDVFDELGRLLTTIEIPSNFDPHVIQSGRIYGFVELPTSEIAVGVLTVAL